MQVDSSADTIRVIRHPEIHFRRCQPILRGDCQCCRNTMIRQTDGDRIISVSYDLPGCVASIPFLADPVATATEFADQVGLSIGNPDAPKRLHSQPRTNQRRIIPAVTVGRERIGIRAQFGEGIVNRKGYCFRKCGAPGAILCHSMQPMRAIGQPVSRISALIRFLIKLRQRLIVQIEGDFHPELIINYFRPIGHYSADDAAFCRAGNAHFGSCVSIVDRKGAADRGAVLSQIIAAEFQCI